MQQKLLLNATETIFIGLFSTVLTDVASWLSLPMGQIVFCLKSFGARIANTVRS